MKNKKLIWLLIALVVIVVVGVAVWFGNTSTQKGALYVLKPSLASQQSSIAQAQKLILSDYFSKFHSTLNCTKPANKQFCDEYNAAQKFNGPGTYNLKNGDVVIIDPFIFKWTYSNNSWPRAMKIIWINQDGDPLLLSDELSYSTDASSPFAMAAFHGIYFMADLSHILNQMQFTFTRSSSDAMRLCGAKNVSGCNVPSSPTAQPNEVSSQTQNFNGFAPADYSSHNEYLTKSFQMCYPKIKDYLGIEPVVQPLFIRLIPTEQGGGCGAGFEGIVCQGTRAYADMIQNTFSYNGMHYPELVDKGNCVDDSAQPHELTHSFVYGTPLQDMKGLNEGLADHVRHKNALNLNQAEFNCLADGYTAGYSGQPGTKQPYLDLNTFRYDISYYHTGECIWKYIEDSYGHDKFLQIMQKLVSLRFKPGKYSFFADIVKPVLGTDIFPTIRSRFNLSSDPTVEKKL